MALLSLRVQRWRIAAEGWIELRSAEPRLRSNQQLERVDTTRNAQIPESADLNSIGCIAALAARGRRPEGAAFCNGLLEQAVRPEAREATAQPPERRAHDCRQFDLVDTGYSDSGIGGCQRHRLHR